MVKPNPENFFFYRLYISQIVVRLGLSLGFETELVHKIFGCRGETVHVQNYAAVQIVAKLSNNIIYKGQT